MGKLYAIFRQQIPAFPDTPAPAQVHEHTTDAFVQCHADVGAHCQPAQLDAEEPGAAYGKQEHEDDGNDHGVGGVAAGLQGKTVNHVESTTHFQRHIHPEQGAHQVDDVVILGENAEDGLCEQGEAGGGDAQGYAAVLRGEDDGGVLPPRGDPGEATQGVSLLPPHAVDIARPRLYIKEHS